MPPRLEGGGASGWVEQTGQRQNRAVVSRGGVRTGRCRGAASGLSSDSLSNVLCLCLSREGARAEWCV
jgi:hypothetical protein